MPAEEAPIAWLLRDNPIFLQTILLACDRISTSFRQLLNLFGLPLRGENAIPNNSQGNPFGQQNETSIRSIQQQFAEGLCKPPFVAPAPI
jgi:hypothetical protein